MLLAVSVLTAIKLGDLDVVRLRRTRCPDRCCAQLDHFLLCHERCSMSLFHILYQHGCDWALEAISVAILSQIPAIVEIRRSPINLAIRRKPMQ